MARRAERERLRFYGSFINGGDLVFDIGANVGERSRAFLVLGATVVAVEPQTECAEQLRSLWKDEARFFLFEGACAEVAGQRELYVADTHTLSSMSSTWIDAVRESGRFESHQWGETRLVPTTTLDALIADHGTPDFVKIDVEGFEFGVLSGLSRAVGCVSIEWSHESLSDTARCIGLLAHLGMSEFNLSLGESMSWELSDWVGAEEAVSLLSHLTDGLAWGDVYARTPVRSPVT